MKNLWNEQDASQCQGDSLEIRVYTSRLLGAEPNLVLHGGGNTSVKLKIKDLFGEEQEVLYVKGSGVDLGRIDVKGFVGLDLKHLQKLRRLEVLSDLAMENQLQTHQIQATLLAPSVEALLHAFLPHKYVDHTHADSILTLTNQNNGEFLIKDALGSRVGILPYVISGLPLAKSVAQLYDENPELEAIVILNHGIFTFGDEAKTSYERMIEYVDRAERYIEKKAKDRFALGTTPDSINKSRAARVIQTIRGACAYQETDGQWHRFYADVQAHPLLIQASQSPDAHSLCQSGVITPDHAIRTKNKFIFLEHLPEDDSELKHVVEHAVQQYILEYDQYFANYSKNQSGLQKLDSLPRVFLVSGIGIVALGETRKAAQVASDIAKHTIEVKLHAESMGGYEAIEEFHVFEMEYWVFQQRKLGRVAPLPLQGQVALITGAGGAIGFGIADRLLAAGAVVVLADIDAPLVQKAHSLLVERYHESRVASLVMDVTNYDAIQKAFDEVSYELGGLDLLVPNAGIAHVAKIETLDPAKFQQVLAVNLMGTFNVIKASIPIFRRQGTGGNIVLISSKNVFDPGAAFGAYSASKAAAHQISRIASLELAEYGVRVNMVNPDAVFGDQKVSSKLWDLIGPDRMKSRGLDPEGLKEYYRQRNLLKISVLPEHVGNVVVFFASNQSPTTGATIPVDGGVPSAAPR
ncbi:bifunctional aldolase/short-chain dehydrogenase [Deltaproteobacteria bacterium TL4]